MSSEILRCVNRKMVTDGASAFLITQLHTSLTEVIHTHIICDIW
jgi:hypothetical protein